MLKLQDFAENYQLSFQDPASPIMEQIINFHNFTMVYITFVVTLVLWFITTILLNFTKGKRVISHKFLIHGTLLEIIWTITPAVILILIAFPSFKLLYLMDEVIEPAITVKVVGY